MIKFISYTHQLVGMATVVTFNGDGSATVLFEGRAFNCTISDGVAEHL